jgi:sugar phosphate isomerase/epimerase
MEPVGCRDLCYQYIELSPREDFMPFFLHPRADNDTVAKFRDALSDAGVEVATVLPLYRWSGRDEDEREAAVRYWKRAIEIIVDLGYNVMNSEFSGRPGAPSYCLGRGQLHRVLRHARPAQVRRHHDRVRVRVGGTARASSTYMRERIENYIKAWG